MSPFPCLRSMRGDPFRHPPIAAERCETRLKNAPGRCAPGRPPSSLPRPSASCPPRIRRAPARIRRRLMAKYSFLSTSHSYFITPFSALSTNAGYARPRHTHSHARHFNALSALFFTPSFPAQKNAGTACPGAWLRCRKSIPSGDISGRGRPERDFPNLRQRQGKSSRTQGVLRHDPRAA